MSLQVDSAWIPGETPVNSVVDPPPNVLHNAGASAFNRSEFEVFATHTTGASGTGDAHGDRMLE